LPGWEVSRRVGRRHVPGSVAANCPYRVTILPKRGQLIFIRTVCRTPTWDDATTRILHRYAGVEQALSIAPVPAGGGYLGRTPHLPLDARGRTQAAREQAQEDYFNVRQYVI
jgi:hypothetical protein